MEWQPIETAPKDGKYVLIFNRWGVFVACWSDDAQLWECKNGPAWQIYVCDKDCWHSCADPSPTHWMPIPKAPK